MPSKIHGMTGWRWRTGTDIGNYDVNAVELPIESKRIVAHTSES